jgi:hypothetical protein
VHDDAHECALEEPKGAQHDRLQLGVLDGDPGGFGQPARAVLVEGEASRRRLAPQLGVQVRADAKNEAPRGSGTLPARAWCLDGTIRHCR